MPTNQPRTFWDMIALTEEGREIMEQERERQRRMAEHLAAIPSASCFPTLDDETYRFTGRPTPRKD